MSILGTMAGNVAGNVKHNGILMQTAKQRGQQIAAARGLQNSTVGAEAAQRAMIDAAMPIAQIDTANQQQKTMQTMQNQFAAQQAGLDRTHQASMQSEDYRQRGILQTMQNQFAAQQSGLDRTHQMNMQNAQQKFTSQQSALDRTQQTNMANLGHNNAMKELSAQVSANTIGKSIDFVQQITNNFDAQIAGILNNTNMAAKDKQTAINQLKASRDSEIAFMSAFMQKIPTTQKNWAAFPNLGVPTIKIS